MASIASKIVAAAFRTLGTLALLAFVGHQLGERCVPKWLLVARATAASHKTRLLQTQRELRVKANIEVDSVPQVVSGVLQKTVVSSKMRMVFLVGLEGTGHHFMTTVLRKMCRFDGVSCPNVCPLATVLYTKLGTPGTPSDYRAGLEGLRSETQALALESDGLHNERIALLTFCECEKQAGMMSFPNYGGVDKPLQYVDLRILAEEAERAGIDLRLIYLVRSARNILLSDTQRRHFGGGFTHEARVLTNNAAVIDSYFHELQPDFITCFRYENISDPVQALRVARFVTPTEEGAANFSQTLIDSVAVKLPAARKNVNDTEGWDLMANRLQGKLDDIERSWC